MMYMNSSKRGDINMPGAIFSSNPYIEIIMLKEKMYQNI